MSEKIIFVSDAPAVSGLTFRHLRGVNDAPAMLAVHLGRTERDAIDPYAQSEDICALEELQSSLGRVMAEGRTERYLLAEVSALVVGYSQIESWSEGDGTWVYLILGWVLPEWRGRGIGTAMLHWAENHVRCLAVADHPDEKFEFAANASSTETDTTALLLHEGYRAGYTVLEMDYDLSNVTPVPPLPEGLELRPVFPEHLLPIANCVAAAYQNEYDDGRYAEVFDPAEFASQLNQPRHDRSLWQVAWHDDQVVGLVLTSIKGVQAEVFEVSVHPDWRRRALGRSLLSRALNVLRQRGVGVIRLRTVAEFRTRASDLYRSVGFRVLKEFPRYRKPFTQS